MLKIAIIGGRGIPARYGGFDTFIEEIATRLVGFPMEVTVYCRKSYYAARPARFSGVKCVYLPSWRFKGLESILHTSLCVLHSLWNRFDLVMVVDPANGPLCLPLKLFRIPVLIHTDGLGWKRLKWGPMARKYYKWTESVSARVANRLITDSQAMQKYYEEEYAAASEYIPYGSKSGEKGGDAALQLFKLGEGKYYLVVARLERENNVHVIIDEYAKSGAQYPLVIVGDAPYDKEYLGLLKQLAGPKVMFLGRIIDQKVLNSLYENAYGYIHGHEVGGTNPSLLRAMALGAFPIVIDVPFNNEVVEGFGISFTKRPGDLAGKLAEMEKMAPKIAEMKKSIEKHITERYDWGAVAGQYAKLFEKVVQSRKRKPSSTLSLMGFPNEAEKLGKKASKLKAGTVPAWEPRE